MRLINPLLRTVDDPNFSPSIFLRACVFHPNYANFKFANGVITSEIRESVWSCLKNDALEVNPFPCNPKSDPSDGVQSQLKSSWDLDIRARIEKMRLLIENESTPFENPTEWWKQAHICKVLTELIPLAKMYLAIPATSSPSESLFSIAGLHQRKARCMLSPENVEYMTFISKNLHLFPDRYSLIDQLENFIRTKKNHKYLSVDSAPQVAQTSSTSSQRTSQSDHLQGDIDISMNK